VLAVDVTRVVAAAPTTVYDLISDDVTQMSRFSPETVTTRWLGGAQAAAVGPPSRA
jgi:hypothetical protein